MSSNNPPKYTSISIDLKKHRIRIFKSLIHLIGDPKHIQILVNPSAMKMAIRAEEKELPNGQTHKVNQRQMKSENSFEIYSLIFLKKLVELVGNLDTNCTYRMSGIVVPGENSAIFDLNTLKKAEV